MLNQPQNSLRFIAIVIVFIGLIGLFVFTKGYTFQEQKPIRNILLSTQEDLDRIKNTDETYWTEIVRFAVADAWTADIFYAEIVNSDPTLDKAFQALSEMFNKDGKNKIQYIIENNVRVIGISSQLTNDDLNVIGQLTDINGIVIPDPVKLKLKMRELYYNYIKNKLNVYVLSSSYLKKYRDSTLMGLNNALIYAYDVNISLEERNACAQRALNLLEKISSYKYNRYFYETGFNSLVGYNGIDKGLDLALIAIRVAQIYRILRDYPGFSDELKGEVKQWLNVAADYIITTHITEAEYVINNPKPPHYIKMLLNNHFSWHNAGLCAIGYALNDIDLVKYAIDGVFYKDYGSNPDSWKYILNNGVIDGNNEVFDKFRHGDGENQGLAYSLYNLYALTLTAEMAYSNDYENLYQYQGENSKKRLLDAYNYYAIYFQYYMDGEKISEKTDHIVGGRENYFGEGIDVAHRSWFMLPAMRYSNENATLITAIKQFGHDLKKLDLSNYLPYYYTSLYRFIQ